MPISRKTWAIGTAMVAVLPVAAQANGYQNLHQSATGLGTAYAANGTGIDDISAIFSNPASLTRFPGMNASVGVTLILPTNSFDNLSATTSDGVDVLDGDPSTPTQFLDTSVSGYWYLSRQINDRVFVGLSFNAPWATASDYTDTAASRYTATTTNLTAYNLSPMLAYKLNDQLSIAGALNFQYYTSSFSTNIPVPGTADSDTDATTDFAGDDWSLGATVGIEYQANDTWRFGASYRTAINHEFDGDVDIDGPSATEALLAGAGVGLSGSAEYEIATPWMLQLGAHAQVTPQWELYGSATVTGWSAFEDTIVETDNGLGTLRVKNGWDDALYVALGAGYQVNDRTKIFGGFAYDQTPTPTDVRNPRAPNADRYYVGLGLSHDLPWGGAVKVGYSHTFFDDAPIRLTDTNNPGRGTLEGDIKIDADIFMLQYVHKF